MAVTSINFGIHADFNVDYSTIGIPNDKNVMMAVVSDTKLLPAGLTPVYVNPNNTNRRLTVRLLNVTSATITTQQNTSKLRISCICV